MKSEIEQAIESVKNPSFSVECDEFGIPVSISEEEREMLIRALEWELKSDIELGC